jgi:hypothetical protein
MALFSLSLLVVVVVRSPGGICERLRGYFNPSLPSIGAESGIALVLVVVLVLDL